MTMKLSELTPMPRKAADVAKKSNVRLTVNLCAMRQARAIPVRVAAEAAGMDHASFNRIERGGEPTIANALRVAAFFDMPVEKIWAIKAAKRRKVA